MKIEKTSEYRLKFCNEKDIDLLKMWITFIGTDAEDWCKRWIEETFPTYGDKLFNSIKMDVSDGYKIEFTIAEDCEGEYELISERDFDENNIDKLVGAKNIVDD